jgi:hypothetical protein
VSVRGIAVTLAAFAALTAAARAHAASGASSARAAIHPILGDWEGSGPDGLGLSFQLVRHGRRMAVRDLALGLPSGCRSAGNPAWEAGAVPMVEFIARGTVLNGSLRPLGPAPFEMIIPSTSAGALPVVMLGRFFTPSRGTLSILSPKVECATGGWPKTLRFTIASDHRVAVDDGVWAGSVTSAPGGGTGTVQIRVTDGGRIETDFQASYTCSDGHTAGFQIGPLPTIGNLIAADGGIGGIISGEVVWSGRFSAGGQLTGTFTSLGCTSPATYTFTAARTGS